MTDVNALLAEIRDVGRDSHRGGYSRHVFDAAECELREWFIERATRLGLDVERDRNGNLWAWWGRPGSNALVTGSHLDSVPGGGECDGPLGVATALAAVADLKDAEWQPRRPFAISVFAEEEGSRFGVACLGSRLMTGSLDPLRVAALTDRDGQSFADVARAAGLDPRHIGPDPASVARIGHFIEVHIEQGRGLAECNAPIGVASSILAHGRWRLEFVGQGNHAGATRMRDRADPVVAAAHTVVLARDLALRADEANPTRATVGRFEPVPGGTNVIASRAAMWLDLRGETHDIARSLFEEVAATAQLIAADEGCTVDIREESYSDRVDFDATVRDRLAAVLGKAPILATGAGHDAGILSAHVPTGMLFVRNPTGVSHAPDEQADPADRQRGTAALVRAIQGFDQA